MRRKAKLKQLLILADTYYPDASIASHRPAQFARYLPEHGWRPRVVCSEARPDNCEHYDPALLTDEVARTVLYRVPKRALPRDPRAKRLSDLRYALTHPAAMGTFFMTRISPMWIYRKPVEFYLGAWAFLRTYLKTHRVDAILATFPDAASLPLAHRCRREFGIPWLADFRDTFDMRHIEPDQRRRRLFLSAEPRVLRNCSALVTVSDHLAECLSIRNARHVDVIPNGYDPRIVDSVGTVPFERFTILFTGTVTYPEQDPRPLFTAMEQLLAEGRIDGRDVTIAFYGKRRQIVDDLLRQHPGVDGIVEVHDPVAHAEVVAMQKGAHGLLHLAHPDTKGVLTGKLFEYLAAGRPILCIPGDGNGVDEVLRRTRAGVVCGDVQSIQRQVLTWYREWKETGTVAYAGRTEEIRRYSRKEQTAVLARLLDELAGGAPRPGG